MIKLKQLYKDEDDTFAIPYLRKTDQYGASRIWYFSYFRDMWGTYVWTFDGPQEENEILTSLVSLMNSKLPKPQGLIRLIFEKLK